MITELSILSFLEMQFIAIFRQHKEHDTQYIQLKLVSTHIIIIDTVLIVFIYNIFIRIYIHNNIALENVLVYKYDMDRNFMN